MITEKYFVDVIWYEDFDCCYKILVKPSRASSHDPLNNFIRMKDLQ